MFLRDAIPLLRGIINGDCCRALVRDFGGWRYFWHYERENGGSIRKEDYVGRVDSARSREDLLRRMAAYHWKTEQEFARRRTRLERQVALAIHTST